MSKKIYGVGINDCPGWGSDKRSPNYNRYHNRVYVLWYDMIRRCYSSRFHEKYPTYKGCEVCVRWRTLSNFAKDLPQIPGYDLWKNNPNQRIALDKDILVIGSMEYSPITCCFVSIGDNTKEMNSRNPLRNTKRVKAINIVTGKVKEYSSINETEKDGFDHGCVSRVCRGDRKQHKGYKFEYID